MVKIYTPENLTWFISTSFLLHLFCFQTSIGDTAIQESHTETVVSGSVVGPDGNPLAGAKIDAVYLSHQPKDHPLVGTTATEVVAHCTSDSAGKFVMTIRRWDASRDIALEIFAYSPGLGVRFQYLEGAKQKFQVNLELPEEITVTGKLKDEEGMPLANATLELSSLRSTIDGDDNSYPFSVRPKDFHAWPAAIRSGKDGSFTVAGVGPSTEFMLELNDERAARQRWTVDVGTDKIEELKLQASKPRNVEGTVVAAGTGDPVANAIVVFSFSENGRFVGQDYKKTNEAGRFAMQCYKAAEVTIRVMSDEVRFEKFNRKISWVPGTTTQRMTLPLDHDGFERLDGTTPYGQPASTIESEVPKVKVTYLNPVDKLTAELNGTIFLCGSATPDGTTDPVRGLFAVDPKTGQCWVVAKDVVSAKFSPNGKYAATISQEGQLEIVALDSDAPKLNFAPENVQGKYWVDSWTKDSDALILHSAAPEKQDYFGQEYWQQQTDKWQYSFKDNKFAKLDVPALLDIEDFSSDGQLFAMHWDTHNHFTGAQLFVANRDGSELRPIARRREQYYWYPRFNPDGKTVLAKHLDASPGDKPKNGIGLSVRIIALDGSGEQSIQVSENYSPEIAWWSPDGKVIAVVAYTNSGFDGGEKSSKLFVVDANGETVSELDLLGVGKFRMNVVEWSAVRLKSNVK